jgi:hypothetical protein
MSQLSFSFISESETKDTGAHLQQLKPLTASRYISDACMHAYIHTYIHTYNDLSKLLPIYRKEPIYADSHLVSLQLWEYCPVI